ncbi:hypothetical protein LINPERPRIM_LOCUS21006, partial [Linum perenne]
FFLFPYEHTHLQGPLLLRHHQQWNRPHLLRAAIPPSLSLITYTRRPVEEAHARFLYEDDRKRPRRREAVQRSEARRRSSTSLWTPASTVRRWKDHLQLLEYFNTRSQQLGIACDYLIEKGDPKEVIYRELRRDRPD